MGEFGRVFFSMELGERERERLTRRLLFLGSFDDTSCGSDRKEILTCILSDGEAVLASVFDPVVPSRRHRSSLRLRGRECKDFACFSSKFVLPPSLYPFPTDLCTSTSFYRCPRPRSIPPSNDLRVSLVLSHHLRRVSSSASSPLLSSHFFLPSASPAWLPSPLTAGSTPVESSLDSIKPSFQHPWSSIRSRRDQLLPVSSLPHFFATADRSCDLAFLCFDRAALKRFGEAMPLGDKHVKMLSQLRLSRTHKPSPSWLRGFLSPTPSL